MSSVSGRTTYRTFQGALRYMFQNRFGVTYNNEDHDYDNGKQLCWSDAADVTSVGVLSLDSDSVVDVDHERKKGARQQINFQANLNALAVTTAFFIADRAVTINGIECSFATAGTDSGGLTAQIFHDTGTQAAGTGIAVMTNSFNLQGTINTPQNATLLAVDGNGNVNTGLVLAAGDRLSIVFTGVTTTLAGLIVSVSAYPGFKEQAAVYTMAANGSLATQGFFIANRDMVITGVNVFYGTAGTNSGAVTIGVTHETGTTAPGSGNAVITALTAKGAANTVFPGVLASTASYLKMLAGDRLSVVFTGTLTALANVVVVVYMQSSSDVVGSPIPYYGQIDISFALATPVSQAIFIADRDYEVVDASAIWSTAGSVSATYDFQINKGTTAIGSGTSVSTGAVSADSTANTTNVLALNVSRRQRLLSQGDRLVAVLGGTLTSLAGMNTTVSLLPR